MGLQIGAKADTLLKRVWFLRAMVRAPCPPIECPVLCVYIYYYQRGGLTQVVGYIKRSEGGGGGVVCLIIGCYVMVSAPCPPIECPVLCVYICHQRGGVSEGVQKDEIVSGAGVHEGV